MPSNSGFSVHAGSVNRRSRPEGAMSEVPARMRPSSPASEPARPATQPGRLASPAANRSVDMPGKNLLVGPSAACVSSRSSGAATPTVPVESSSRTAGRSRYI